MIVLLAALLASANPVPSFHHGWRGEPDNVTPPPPDNPYRPPVGVNFVPLPVAFLVHDHPVDLAKKPQGKPAPKPTEWQLKHRITDGGELVQLDDLHDPSIKLEW